MLRTSAPLIGALGGTNMAIPTDYALMSQMAVALAGFTGIVGASQKRQGRNFTTREQLHLGLIVETSVFVLILGFLPSTLSLLEISDTVLWKAAVVALLLAHLTTWVVLMAQTNMGRALLTELKGTEKAIGLASIPFGLSAVAAEVAMSFGYLPDYIPFLYELVLILFLSVGMWSFLSLLLNDE